MLTDSIVDFDTSPQHRFAYLIAVLLVICTVIAIPYADLPLTEVKPFLPMFAACVVVTELITAYLLMVIYRVSNRAYLLPLAGAYAFVAVIVVIQLLSFPGVFAPQGLLYGNSQSAVWMWVFWHSGYAGLVGIALIMQKFALMPALRFWQGVALFSLAPLLAVLVATLSLQTELPVLIVKGSYYTLSHSVTGQVVWWISMIAVLLAIDAIRKRYVVGIFVLIAMLASLADVTLTLVAGQRYSLGWYMSRILSIVSSLSVLIGLLQQIALLYQNLTVANRALVKTATSDGLTGIANRRLFDLTAAQEWLRAVRNAEPLSVLLIDIDQFKAYNDYFGHQQGDECLIRVATCLANSTKRPSDLAARYGGEEFAFILPNTTREGAWHIAEQVRLAVMALALPTPQSGAVVTISVGYATWLAQSDIASFADLLKIADEGLYRAKARGRNCAHTVQTQE